MKASNRRMFHYHLVFSKFQSDSIETEKCVKLEKFSSKEKANWIWQGREFQGKNRILKPGVFTCRCLPNWNSTTSKKEKEEMALAAAGNWAFTTPCWNNVTSKRPPYKLFTVSETNIARKRHNGLQLISLKLKDKCKFSLCKRSRQTVKKVCHLHGSSIGHGHWTWCKRSRTKTRGPIYRTRDTRVR